MSLLAIELNDAGILAANADGPVVEPSPGYALLDGKELRVGGQAERLSRLKPRWIHNRYWDRLDTGPMPRPFPRDLSHADVAHAQLSGLWQRLVREAGAESTASVLMVVPGSFSVDQLGLILGIARACDIPVTGMVDAAVAAAAVRAPGSRILYLEALLHRMLWTELVVEGQELVRRRVEVLETGGLIAIREAWAKRIAQLLVRQTRFDPFHHGSAEQTLYDRLPCWMAELAQSGQTLVTLQSDDKEHSVELDAAGCEAVSASVTAGVVEAARVLAGSGEAPVIMLSERVAAIPGVVRQLATFSGDGVVVIENGSAARGAIELRSSIESPGGDLPFVARLPVRIEAPPRLEPLTPPPTTLPQGPSTAAPTHVLFAGVAYPITGEPLWLGSSGEAGDRSLNVGGPMPGLSRRHCVLRAEQGSVIVEDHSSYGTYLNDRRVQDQSEVGVGDRLRLGSPGVELLLIAVTQDDV